MRSVTPSRQISFDPQQSGPTAGFAPASSCLPALSRSKTGGAFLSRATSAIALNNTARARGVEPREAVLEATGSSGSTLV
jgi:hypothetical protein